MRPLALIFVTAAILSGCTTDRLEHGSHADSYRWNPKPNKP